MRGLRLAGMMVLMAPGLALAQAQADGLPPPAGPEVHVEPGTGSSAQQSPEDRLPDLGPNVVITPRPGQPMIEEYRVNDRVFMIKVTPRKGFSYYLMDTNGDGRLDTRRNAVEPDLLIPAWPLLRWK